MAEGAPGQRGPGGAGRLRSATSRAPPPRRGRGGGGRPALRPAVRGCLSAREQPGSSPAAALPRRPRAERSGGSGGARGGSSVAAGGRRRRGRGARVPAGAEGLP